MEPAGGFPDLDLPVRPPYPPLEALAVGALRLERFVVDGEIVIVREGRLDFDALLQRIHPAESRVRRLASETPATLLASEFWGRRAG